MQALSANKFLSVYRAGRARLVSTSSVARASGSCIDGKSTRSSIVRSPSSDQMRSYSRRGSTSVGWADQSMPTCRKHSRATVTAVLAQNSILMTGLELQHHLVRGGFHIPAIAITAHNEFGAEERCRSAGVRTFLLKPIEEVTLIAAIEAAVEDGHTKRPS